MEAKKRDDNFDIMKGIGIIAVVACHCDCWFGYFTAFHLPIFMFICGYFHPMKDADSISDLWKILKKRYVQLGIPLLIFSVIFILLQPLFVYFHWLPAPAHSISVLSKNTKGSG